MFLIYPLLLGVVIGLLRRGSLARLAEVRLRFAWAFLILLLVQVVVFAPWVAEADWNLRWGPAVWVGSMLLTLAVTVANVRQAGFPLVALGTASNLAAILANGGKMPALAESLALLHGPELPALIASGRVVTNNVLVSSETALIWLTDVFVLPPWLPVANVFSVGDVLIGLGAFLWLQSAMTAASPQSPHP